MSSDNSDGGKLTLHCFAGDTQGLSVLLLADFLGAKLAVRFLKPINLTEKLYKQTLTKTFPQLQVEGPAGSVFLERSPAILRLLGRAARGPYAGSSDPFKAALDDQLLDSLHQDVLPPLFVLQAAHQGIVELGEAELLEPAKDLQRALGTLNRQLRDLLAHGLGVCVFDFLPVAVAFALQRLPRGEAALRAASEVGARIARCEAADEKFGKAVAAFRPRAEGPAKNKG